MAKWEYKIEKISADDCATHAIGISKAIDPTAAVAAKLSVLGAAGWELVSVTLPFIQQNCNVPIVAWMFLKREKGV
jgi:hypothetical protein